MRGGREFAFRKILLAQKSTSGIRDVRTGAEPATTTVPTSGTYRRCLTQGPGALGPRTPAPCKHETDAVPRGAI